MEDRFVAKTVRWHWALILAAMLLIGLAGLWLVGFFDGGVPPFDGQPMSRKLLRAGWFAVFVSTCMSVFGLWYVFAAPAELIVMDEQGVICRRILEEGHVKWQDVRSVHIVPIFGLPGGKRLRLDGDRGKLLYLRSTGTDKSFDDIVRAVGWHLEPFWRR